VKAYDMVQHWYIKELLEYYGVDKKTIDTIIDIHAKLVATLEFNGKISKSFEIENRIRQEDVLVPLIFLLVINPILEVITQKCKGYKTKFSNLAIFILAYIDDIIIISDNLNDFNLMCQIITEILEYIDIQVNKTKTYFLTNQETKNYDLK
jgi:hypothetical protein